MSAVLIAFGVGVNAYLYASQGEPISLAIAAGLSVGGIIQALEGAQR